MLPPSAIDVQGFTPRDVSTRGLLSETLCAELRPDVTATSTCHILEARAVARCHEEFDETIRTASEPECSKRKMVESMTGGSTRSMDGRSRQGFSKGSASLQSLVRRRSRRYGGGGSSLPLEAELSSRQAVYPADLVKDNVNTAVVFRNGEEETQTATPTSTLIYATSSAQPSTSRTDNNAQDVSSSASNVITSGSNATSTISGSGGRFGNTVAVSLPRNTTNVVTPRPSTSSWNNSIAEQESDYVVDPVQGNAYHKGHFLGKVRAYLYKRISYKCVISPGAYASCPSSARNATRVVVGIHGSVVTIRSTKPSTFPALGIPFRCSYIHTLTHIYTHIHTYAARAHVSNNARRLRRSLKPVAQPANRPV